MEPVYRDRKYGKYIIKRAKHTVITLLILRIGVPYETVLMEGNYRSVNHTTQPSHPATEFRMLWWHGSTRFMSIARGKKKKFPYI